MPPLAEEVPQDQPEGDPTAEVTPPEPETPNGDEPLGEPGLKALQDERDARKALEAEAATYKRLLAGEDRDGFRDLAEKFGYEIPEDDEPDDDEEDDPIAPVRSELSEIKKWKEQQEQEKAVALFKQDVDQLAKDAEIELKERDYTRIWRDAEDLARQSKKAFDQTTVEQVFKDMLDERKEFEKTVIERYTGSKKAPQSPGSGKSATQVPDLDTDQARHAHLRERIAQQQRGD